MKHTIALYATFLAFAVSLTGCGSCTLYQRHSGATGDREPYYIVEACHEGTPQQTTTLVCTSPTRIPTGSRNCR